MDAAVGNRGISNYRVDIKICGLLHGPDAG